MTVSVEPRMGATAEYETIADVWARCSPPGAPSARDLEDRISALRASAMRTEYRIASVDGEAAGFVGFAVLPTARDRGVMSVRLMVLPEHRRRGIATLLHDTVVRDIEADIGPFPSFAYVDEREQAGIAFARARGYDTAGRYLESTIDPRTSDPDPWLHHVRHAAEAGITIRSIEDLRRDGQEWFTRLHDLVTTVSSDAPFPIPEQPVSIDVLRKRMVESSAAMLDATFVATIGDDWVGMTELRRDGAPDHWVQDLTGVVRGHRHTGVATALKARSLLHARAKSVISVRTWNHERNAAMRAINERFGFTLSHGILIMLRNATTLTGPRRPPEG